MREGLIKGQVTRMSLDKKTSLHSQLKDEYHNRDRRKTQLHYSISEREINQLQYSANNKVDVKTPDRNLKTGQLLPINQP